MCSLGFQYSGCVLNTGKGCFQRWVKKCTLSCSHTNRYVWQTWFSEVSPSVPARGGHLHCKISPFPSVSRDANTHPDLLLFFHISFLLLLPVFFFFFCRYLRLVCLSCSFQGFRLKKWIYSSFISLFCFFFHIPFYARSLSISPSATHFYIMTPPLSALHTRPSLSELFFLPSHFLPLSSAPTHQGPREGKWKVCVFCSSAVWQWEAKLLFYGFIYGSVDFWRCAHHTWGAEGEWRAAWCELLLVPPVELDQHGGRGRSAHIHRHEFGPNMH